MLTKSLLDSLQRDVPLAKLTTWQIGGNAQYLAEPDSIGELCDVAGLAREEGIPINILGRGSNTLIDSDGVPGIVVCLRKCLQRTKFDASAGTLFAEAGCPMPTLATLAGKHGIAGYEFLIGIPGTVGAGVAINAGLGRDNDNVSMDSIVLGAQLLDPATGEFTTLPKEKLGLANRHSDVADQGLWVVGATFDASVLGDPVASAELRRKHLDKRAVKQPLNKKCSGSVFKIPEAEHAAGWYIEQAGLKGHRRGDAAVTEKHANWIENMGNARSQDVKDLIQEIIETVYEKFGVTLVREVKYIP